MTWAGWFIISVLGFSMFAVIADDKKDNSIRVGSSILNLGIIVLILMIGTGHV